MEAGTAQSRIITIPQGARDILFSVRCRQARPELADRTVLWVRAGDVGSHEWGQSAWVELVRMGPDRFESKPVPLGSLWLKPGETCRIEVYPEGLESPEVRIALPVPADPSPAAPATTPNRFTWIESPSLWLLILLLGLMAACVMFSGKGSIR